MSDNKIKAALIVYIICIVILFAIGSSKYVCWLNMLSGIGMCGYWLQKYLRFKHRVEGREIVFLLTEFIFVVLSVCFLYSALEKHWLLVSVYVIASLHLAAAILFTGFMFLFKMKKLF